MFVAAPDGRAAAGQPRPGELLGIHFEAGSNYREQIEARDRLEDGQPVPGDDLPTERARRGVPFVAQLTVLRPDESRRDLWSTPCRCSGRGRHRRIVIVAADVTALKGWTGPWDDLSYRRPELQTWRA